MNLKAIGWIGFIFLAIGLLILYFGPQEWYAYGCAGILTAVTLYVTGFVMVARQISRIRGQAGEMMRRVAEEMERRKGGGGGSVKKVIDVEKVDPKDPPTS